MALASQWKKINMETPQIIWIALAAATLGISLVKNGESRGTYNFFYCFIGLAIEVWILWAGGFFG